MAGPITWKTINGRSNEGAARMMESASESMDSSFNIFNKLIDDTEQVQTDNRNTTIKNNTLDARSFLQGITDPDEMARVQASGEFRDKVASYGGRVDREALQGAGRDHLTGLRQQASADYQYGQTQTAQQEAPAVRGIKTAIANRDWDTADGIMAQNPELQNMPELAQMMQSGQRSALVEGRQDKTYNREQARIKLNEAADQRGLQIAENRTSTQNDAVDKRNRIASDLGIEVVNGSPVLAGQDQQTLQRFQEATSGIKGVPSATQDRQAFLRSLTGLDAADRNAQLASYDATQTAATELAGPDRANLDAEVAHLDGIKESKLTRLNEDRRIAEQQNGYIGEVGDPNAEASRIIGDKLNDDAFDPWLSNSTGRKTMTDNITKALSSGVNITVDGKTVRVKASPAMVDLAFETARQSGTPNSDFNSILKEVMSQDQKIQQWKEAQSFLGNHRQAVDDVNTGYTRSLTATTARAKANAGLNAEGMAKFTRRLERSLKPDMTRKQEEKVIRNVGKELAKDPENTASTEEAERPDLPKPSSTGGVSGLSELEPLKALGERGNNNQESVGTQAGRFVNNGLAVFNPFDERNLVKQGFSKLSDFFRDEVTYSNLPARFEQPVSGAEFWDSANKSLKDSVQKGIDAGHFTEGEFDSYLKETGKKGKKIIDPLGFWSNLEDFLVYKPGN